MFYASSAIYLAIVGLLLIFCYRPAAKRRQDVLAALFLGASFLFILLNRLRILQFDLAINPDEAMMAANAMRTLYGWLNWDTVDPVTSGPLNSAILAWPYLFGGDITLFSTRLTGLACVFGAIGLLFFTIRNLSASLSAAILALLPCILLFATTTRADFVHYSSEHLPLLLLSLALFLFAGSFRRNSLPKLVGCAVVLGLIPFAKLQAAPLAAVIGAFVLVRAATMESFLPAASRVLLVVPAALAGAFAFLLPLAMSGGLDDAFKSYIVQPRLRTGPWSDQIPAMVFEAKLFLAVAVAAAASLMVAVAAWLAARRHARVVDMSRPWRWCAALALILLPVSYAAVTYTGRPFLHYLLLAIPALVLVAGAALAVIDAVWPPRRWWGWLSHAAMLVLVCALWLPAARAEALWGFFWYARAGGTFLRGKLFEAPRTLSWLRPTARDSLLCWGWTPECYVDAALRPATRETTNENQIYGIPLVEYFRARFIGDFNASNPDFMIDAVAPGSFMDEGKFALPVFPALHEIVERDFTLVSGVIPPDRCPRVYVRKSRLAELEQSLIAFTAIQASAARPGHEASAVDDGSVFETCNDNWLLPAGALGSLTLRFHRAAPVRTIAILNTRRESEGRPIGSRDVRLSVVSAGRVVHAREVRLRPFPFWTSVRLDNALEADAITLDILSFDGFGGGLNEVKAYRD